ncbi:MAG TPA: hypothetical protein VM618_08585 [Acidimicrobiia bacterium]|nr:hypothetical protein [Acidimicrobiia bacterium]
MEEPAPEPLPAPVPDEAVSFRPKRSAFVATFVAVVLAGLLGAGIGAGLGDVGCGGDDCTVPVAVGALVGGAIGAGGVAVVGILVLRAMAEWNRQQAMPLVIPEPGDEPPEDPGDPPT